MSRSEIPKVHEPNKSHRPYILHSADFHYRDAVLLNPSLSTKRQEVPPHDFIGSRWKLYSYEDTNGDDSLWIAVSNNSLGAIEIDALSMYIAPHSMSINGIIEDWKEMLEPSEQNRTLNRIHTAFHPYYWHSLLHTHLPPLYQTYNQHPRALDQYTKNAPIRYLQGALQLLRDAQLQKNKNSIFASALAQKQVREAENQQEEQRRHLKAMGYRHVKYYYPEDSERNQTDYYLDHQNGTAVVSYEGEYRGGQRIAEEQYLTPVLPFRIVGNTVVPDLEVVIPDEIVGLSNLPTYAQKALTEDPYNRDSDHDMIALLDDWNFNIRFKPSTLLGIYALFASSPQACERIWNTQAEIAGQPMSQAQLPLLALIDLPMVIDSPAAQTFIDAAQQSVI